VRFQNYIFGDVIDVKKARITTKNAKLDKKLESQKTFHEYSETSVIAEDLQRLNLEGQRMQLYNDMTRQQNELDTTRARFKNREEFIAEKAKIVARYRERVKDIDFQLNRLGEIYNHALRKFTDDEKKKFEVRKNDKKN
jgi:hypothetical protein